MSLRLDPPWPRHDRNRAVETWTTELPCPRCNARLFGATKGGFTLSACGGCGGVWLGNEAAQRLVRAGSLEAVDLAEVAARHAKVFAVPVGSGACPVCREALSRVVVPPTQVEIDVCAAHGTWFDRRELTEVVKIVAPHLLPRAAEIRPAPVAIPAAPAQPAPTAREIAREVVLEEERRRASSEMVGNIIDWIVKN